MRGFIGNVCFGCGRGVAVCVLEYRLVVSFFVFIFRVVKRKVTVLWRNKEKMVVTGGW